MCPAFFAARITSPTKLFGRLAPCPYQLSHLGVLVMQAT
jgi:hypothetical protein